MGTYIVESRVPLIGITTLVSAWHLGLNLGALIIRRGLWGPTIQKIVRIIRNLQTNIGSYLTTTKVTIAISTCIPNSGTYK